MARSSEGTREVEAALHQESFLPVSDRRTRELDNLPSTPSPYEAGRHAAAEGKRLIKRMGVFVAQCSMVRVENIIEAVDLSVKAMKGRRKLLGQEHEDTLKRMSMAGLAYNMAGRWAEAEELQVQEMEATKTVLGKEHPSTLSYIANLAYTWKSQGQRVSAAWALTIPIRYVFCGLYFIAQYRKPGLIPQWWMPEGH